MFDDFFLGLEDKSIRAGDDSPKETKSRVVDVGNVGGVFEVRAEHGEVLGVVDVTEAVEPIDAFFNEGIR